MPRNPHDRLVKKTFAIVENAEGELRAVLPEAIASRVDWSTLRLEPGSFVNEDARERHTDLLFSASVAGHRALLYLLLEHQSRADRWMPKRMLTYVDRIWTAQWEAGAENLPIVIPLVLHHSKRGWTVARRLEELIDADDELLALARPYVPGFEIMVDDLGRVPERAILERAMSPMGRIVLWALRAQRLGHDPELIAHWAPELERARSLAGREALEVFFVYLSEVDGGADLMSAILDAEVAEEVREVAMGLRKEWEEQAAARGREEGREEGRGEGRDEVLARARQMVRKLLRLRFGELGADDEARVAHATMDELDRWADRILTADALDAVWA